MRSGTLVYAGMMGFSAWCLIDGAIEHYRSGQTTMLLQLIIWPAIAISAVLLVLLTCVALATASDSSRRRRMSGLSWPFFGFAAPCCC